MSNSVTEKKQNKAMGGWLIVLGAMLMQAIPVCVINNVQPLFINSLMGATGSELASVSLMFTIGSMVSALSAPIVGNLYKKVPVKVMYLVGGGLIAGAIFGFSIATQVWQLYLFAAISNIGTCIVSSIGIPLLINNWFDGASNGKALGLAFAGTSIGNIFLQPITLNLIGNGYASAYRILAIAVLVVAIPVTLLIMRMPKNDSEIVRGTAKAKDGQATPVQSVDVAYTVKEAQKNKNFWLISLGFTCVGLFVSAYSVQYAAYFQEIQLETSVIALSGSLFAAGSLIGNVAGGVLFDKLGVVKCLMVSAVLFVIAGASMLMVEQNSIFAYAFSLIRGFGCYVYMMGPAFIVAKYFGKKEYAGILGVMNLIFAIGFAGGAAIFAVVVGAVGYSVSWMIMLGAVVASFVLLITGSKGMEKMNVERIAKIKAGEKIA